MKDSRPQETKPTIRFSAEVSSGNFMALPKNVSAKLPSRGTMMVEGTINSFPFRSALDPDGKGNHQLRLSKAMRDAASRDAEEMAAVEITRLGKESETRMPLDLRKALATTPRARSLWEDITSLARRDWIFWIISGRKPETRQIRIEKACDKLASGMRRVCCFAGIAWL